MSLVGSPPASFGSNTNKLTHTERLDVFLGIIGLWQLVSRGKLEFDDRLRLHIAYIERAGVWFDIIILFRTIAVVVTQRGVY